MDQQLRSGTQRLVVRGTMVNYSVSETSQIDGEYVQKGPIIVAIPKPAGRYDVDVLLPKTDDERMWEWAWHHAMQLIQQAEGDHHELARSRPPRGREPDWPRREGPSWFS